MHDCVHAMSRIDTRAGRFPTETGHFLVRPGYRKAAIIVITTVFLITMFITQFGRAVRFEKEAEVAFSQARQLLHEADKENRKVRPLPLSLVQDQIMCTGVQTDRQEMEASVIPLSSWACAFPRKRAVLRSSPVS